MVPFDRFFPEQTLLGVLLRKHFGKLKAGFFRALGYNKGNSEQLIEDLINIARSEDVTEKKLSPYGAKYVIDGILQTPHGTLANIRTVWIIEIGEEIPRFVTAHPY